MTNVFDPPNHIENIVVVGCGGTGAQVARHVARLAYDMRRGRLSVPAITLIDPDTVEAKNVGRQLFTDAEIGQNKAVALMRRFNAALGLQMEAISEPLDAERHFGRYERGRIVIGAVDTHQGRIEMSKIQGGVWIDCGNHKDGGQVVIGNTSDWNRIADQKPHVSGVRVTTITMRQMVMGQKPEYPDQPLHYTYLPNAAALFPSLLEPEPVVEVPAGSCAALIEAGEQHLFVNDWMAQVAAMYLSKLLRRQPVTTHMTYIDADGMNVRSAPIDMASILAYRQEAA